MVVGVGNVLIKMDDGMIKTLCDLRYVAMLERNLISLSTLDANGCWLCRQCYEDHKRGIDFNGRYKKCLMRFGHISEHGMDELSKQGVFGGKRCVTFSFCESYVFKPVPLNNTVILDYIHLDI